MHAQNTPFADSSRPNKAYGDVPDQHGGVTPLGRKAVGELSRLGVLIDVSQLTPAGVKQTVELSRTPVIASRRIAQLRGHAAQSHRRGARGDRGIT